MKKKNKQIFALDIGTRSVIGLLLEKSEENYYLKEIVIMNMPIEQCLTVKYIIYLKSDP